MNEKQQSIIPIGRAKRTDNGEWIEGYLFYKYDSFYEEYRLHIQKLKPKAVDHRLGFSSSFEVDPDTVGYFTGYEKVFTDDIIRADFDKAIGIIKLGEYSSTTGNDFHLGFYIDWQGEDDHDLLRRDLGYWMQRSDVKVIGNIYDDAGILS